MGVLLVSEGKLKSFTNISRNTDMDVLRGEIQITQDMELQALLGTKFYNHLLSQVTPTGNTFNSDELTLVNDYIAPYLIQVSYYNALPHMHIRSMNIGLVSPSSVDGGRQGVDIETMKYLRGIQKQRADFYKMRLVDWLNIGYGQNLFPDYNNQTSKDGMYPDRTAKYNSPIVLDATTRYGWSKRNVGRSYPTYSDRAHYDSPCDGCI
jgi:hypothetical protein